MKKFNIKLICLILSLMLAVAAFGGCSKTETISSSEPTSSEQTSSEENPSDETESTETPLEENLTPDEDEEEFPEEDEIFYEELYVHNTEKEIINNNFLGVNMIHQLYSRMPDKYNRVYNEKQLALENRTFADMDVKMIRSFYGSSLCYDVEKGYHDFSKDKPFLEGFIQSCLDMQKIGVEVGITPQWHLYGLFKEGYIPTTNGASIDYAGWLKYNEDGTTNVDASAKGFEKFVEESVLYFKSRGVNNIKQFYCFTEVNNTLYNLGKYTTDDKTMMERRHYEILIPVFDKMIRAVDQGLKNAGLRNQYKIVAPCDNWRYDYEQTGEGYSKLVKHCVENLRDQVDIIGSHNGYALSTDPLNDVFYDYLERANASSMEFAKKAGKDYWMDEGNVAPSNIENVDDFRAWKSNPMVGLSLSAMISGGINAGISNMFVWALYDQQWPNNTGTSSEFSNGIQIAGFLPCYLENVTPKAPYYALSMITRHFGAGKTYNCEVGLGIYISAIKRTDGETAFMVVNYNFIETPIKVLLDKSLGGKKLYRYVYNPSVIAPAADGKLITSDATVSNVKYGFADTIPGASVAIYTTQKPN